MSDQVFLACRSAISKDNYVLRVVPLPTWVGTYTCVTRETESDLTYRKEQGEVSPKARKRRWTVSHTESGLALVTHLPESRAREIAEMMDTALGDESPQTYGWVAERCPELNVTASPALLEEAFLDILNQSLLDAVDKNPSLGKVVNQVYKRWRIQCQ